MLRTHNCGELTKKDKGKEVILSGWLHSSRVQKKFSFIDLRDRYGVTQLFLDEKFNDQISKLGKESVIQAKGIVQVKPAPNPKLKTGEIEVKVSSIEVLNESDELPLDLSGEIESTEETRLKYRYLDLRTEKMKNNIITRYKITKSIRDSLHKQDFLEIETPMLAKSTPEGARDYLVPSRVNPKKFFALPQSPQIFKQLLMVSGFDRYFQIVRCFRDEDLRADRQPEFTQLDMEMSFVGEEDVYFAIEQLMKDIWKDVLNINIKIPFQRMTYEEAIKKHKTDKPDLRKNKDEYAFLWVTDFPLLDFNEEEKRYVAMHHPFTSPKLEDVKLLDKNPEKARARAYDLVLNGEEIGGGSIRIHKKELQEKIFNAIKMTKKEAEDKFGFLMNAFKYGAPPHGGIALGLDRIAAIVTGNSNIREVIAFPKNQDAKDLMMGSPSEVDKSQLKELGIKFEK
ncbi:aspartate--tRNA ligase [Candidatus Woesearchaeota archaeon]|nr:aspartate--tRNA ligase [Candidatus Woesearchaeota archaeon]